MFEHDLDKLIETGELITIAETSSWEVNTYGMVDPVSGLTVTPEAWRARHYRRAVMRGAGVYRLGLWAHLGARRGLAFTVPEAGATVEPHRVTVKGVQLMSLQFIQMPVKVWKGGIRPSMGRVVFRESGMVSSTRWAVPREPFRVFAAKQIAMRGAGVYQVGLWAMLAHRQTDAQAEGGAALGGNDGGTLARFVLSAHGRVRHSVRWRTARKVRVRQAFKGLTRAYFGSGIYQICNCSAFGRPLKFSRRGWAKRDAANKAMYRQGSQWCRLFPNTLLDTDPTEDCPWDNAQLELWQEALVSWGRPGTAPNDLKVGRIAALMGERPALREYFKIRAAYYCENRAAFAPVLAAVIKRGDAYRALLARRVRPQRPPMRVPRPLYARAVPPAAPLAPPAL